ncbi:hypothetical protein RB653_009104 [Dictyostelium firmibasis]|uniref:Ubiquitin-like domain-containing protein n=1 Tax=Dictyostelium firmibasis TaxID=79012 RepID=A0AAN7YT94_9MYCE
MDPLLKTGLESLLNIKIENESPTISFKEYSSIVHGVNHNLTNIDNNKNNNNNLKEFNSKFFNPTDNVTIYIRHISGKTFEMKTNLNYSLSDIKKQFFENYEKSIKSSDISLYYNGNKLNDNKSLAEYNIRCESTLALFIKNSKYSIINTFDPHYNYDFSGIIDIPNSFKRGGYFYQRPCGSFRYALLVLGRFNEPNEVWLGHTGRAGFGEWAVTYHNSISDENCLTTPSFDDIKKESFTFNYNGDNYYLIFQNRVNTSTITRVVIKNVEYWKSPNSSSDHIRPYSICIGRI